MSKILAFFYFFIDSLPANKKSVHYNILKIWIKIASLSFLENISKIPGRIKSLGKKDRHWLVNENRKSITENQGWIYGSLVHPTGH